MKKLFRQLQYQNYMKRKSIPLILLIILGAATACYRKNNNNNTNSYLGEIIIPAPNNDVIGSAPRQLPKATAFRIDGDYSNHVAVTLSPDGKLLYYPAPTDITPNSKPIQLADGWWLNRQGAPAGSVFLKYTFDEYAALPATPTQQELIKAIIPGARFTDFATLPISMTEAEANPALAISKLKVK